jgi:hypothetical protein
MLQKQAQRELKKLCRLLGVFWNERRSVVPVTYVERVEDAGGVLHWGRKENGGKGGKKGYMYSSPCNLFHFVRFVGN